MSSPNPIITVIKFKVSLSDGTNTMEFETPNVEWLTGGDSNVSITKLVTIEEGELLDSWEANKTELTVSIEPSLCGEIEPSGHTKSAECTDEITDYNSQSGTATLTWKYNPKGPSEIYLTFLSEA